MYVMAGSMVSVFSHPAAEKDGSIWLDSCVMRGLQGSALGPDRRSALYTSDPEIKTRHIDFFSLQNQNPRDLNCLAPLWPIKGNNGHGQLIMIARAK